MEKKTKIILGLLTIIVLIAIFGSIWWVIPVYLFNGVSPEDISKIRVSNGTTNRQFDITDPEDITFIVENIQKIPMKRNPISGGIGTTYALNFFNTEGEVFYHLTINKSYILEESEIYYQSEEELRTVNQYLLSLEKAEFPEDE